jgi:hypothetical protein
MAFICIDCAPAALWKPGKPYLSNNYLNRESRMKDLKIFAKAGILTLLLLDTANAQDSDSVKAFECVTPERFLTYCFYSSEKIFK